MRNRCYYCKNEGDTWCLACTLNEHTGGDKYTHYEPREATMEDIIEIEEKLDEILKLLTAICKTTPDTDICSNCAFCENGTYCNELDSITTPDSTCKEFERKGE